MYVALLRGINVGGKRQVEMKRLKTTFERAGMKDVQTYINSGNVVFSTETKARAELVRVLESAIQTDFGFPVQVFLRDTNDIRAIVDTMPDWWVDDKDAKCNVMFLSEDFDSKDTLELLTIKPGIDDVMYVPGAVLWRVERPNVTRSGMAKIVGTKFYTNMTARNCNTVRKLDALMNRYWPPQPK
jgi:uncharacterized protein (DUF1697 family)